jgi:hypothetical protein
MRAVLCCLLACLTRDRKNAFIDKKHASRDLVSSQNGVDDKLDVRDTHFVSAVN